MWNLNLLFGRDPAWPLSDAKHLEGGVHVVVELWGHDKFW